MRISSSQNLRILMFGLLIVVGCNSGSGQRGAAGLDGSQGPMGPAGQLGQPGPAGLTGLTGATGSQGALGAPGVPGPPGPTGGGLYTSRSVIDCSIAAATVSTPSFFASAIAACADVRDLPLSGGCSSQTGGTRVFHTGPMAWASPLVTAGWLCTFASDTLFETGSNPGLATVCCIRNH